MTPFTLTTLAELSTLTADTLIDVRAPSEFAEDHLPGAINLPVLSDEERAQVGTIYKQESPFAARKIGAALVAENTAHHLKTTLSTQLGSWQPLVYCWRGGQRSGAFATILDQIGWRVQILKGGYQSYRRKVVSTLYETPLHHRFVLIEGGTGTAKTALLHQLSKAGAQSIDLEDLAKHRGSLFGGIAVAQPSQKLFETRLAEALSCTDPDSVTFLEAESSKIGERLLPPQIWSAMASSPRIRIEAPLAARADHLTRAYADLVEDDTRLRAQINQLRPYHATRQIEDWLDLAQDRNWPALAQSLMAEHYDPRYRKSAARQDQPVQTIALSDLNDDTLAQTAARLARSVR